MVVRDAKRLAENKFILAMPTVADAVLQCVFCGILVTSTHNCMYMCVCVCVTARGVEWQCVAKCESMSYRGPTNNII